MTRFIPKINREQKVLVMLKCVKKIRSSQDNIICISFCCLPLLSGKSMILFSFSQRTLKQKIFAKTTTHTKFVWDWVVHVYYKCIDNIYITLASLIWQAVFKNSSCLIDFEKYSGCLPNIVLELHFVILDFSALCFFMFFTINTIISWSAVNPGELCGPKKRRITRVHSVSQGVTKNCHFSDLGPAIMVELWPFKKKLENQSSSTHRAHLK